MGTRGVVTHLGTARTRFEGPMTVRMMGMNWMTGLIGRGLQSGEDGRMGKGEVGVKSWLMDYGNNCVAAVGSWDMKLEWRALEVVVKWNAQQPMQTNEPSLGQVAHAALALDMMVVWKEVLMLQSLEVVKRSVAIVLQEKWCWTVVNMVVKTRSQGSLN